MYKTWNTPAFKSGWTVSCSLAFYNQLLTVTLNIHRPLGDKTMLLRSCLMLSVAALTMAQGDATNEELLKELTITKRIQRNMKRKFTAQITALQRELQALEATTLNSGTVVEDARSQMQAALADFQQQVTEVAAAAAPNNGSSYVRWGRTNCTDDASLVYSGFMGGKFSNQVGSGRNALCLPSQPQYDNTTTPRQFGIVAGAEYKGMADLLNQDVPCSVCLAQQSTTIMVPATLTCPPGWTAQYSGHLVSALTTAQGTEYLCLDASPEGDPEDERPVFKNGYVLYYVLSKCGSLPCPPYENDRVVTCVVCSK